MMLQSKTLIHTEMKTLKTNYPNTQKNPKIHFCESTKLNPPQKAPMKPDMCRPSFHLQLAYTTVAHSNSP